MVMVGTEEKREAPGSQARAEDEKEEEVTVAEERAAAERAVAAQVRARG